MTSGTGTCTVKYDQAGDANYNAGPAGHRDGQRAEGRPDDQRDDARTGVGVLRPAFTVAATGGGSGNAVTFSSSGACSNAGATFTITSATGTCSVKYDQAGDANYNAAPQVTESVSVGKADQTITVINARPGVGRLQRELHGRRDRRRLRQPGHVLERRLLLEHRRHVHDDERHRHLHRQVRPGRATRTTTPRRRSPRRSTRQRPTRRSTSPRTLRRARPTTRASRSRRPRRAARSASPAAALLEHRRHASRSRAAAAPARSSTTRPATPTTTPPRR